MAAAVQTNTARTIAVSAVLATAELAPVASGAARGGAIAAQVGTAFAKGAAAANNAGPLRFSQPTASPFFSAEGSMGGRAISSVVDDLRAGVLKPADLPVEYLVRDGNRLLINTRSSLALKQANIPESSWSLINRTGVESAEAAMTDRLLHNGLGSGGTDVLRITGAGKGASVLRP
jgi:hypothetical protein